MTKENLYEIAYLYSKNITLEKIAMKMKYDEEEIKTNLEFFLLNNRKKLAMYTYDFVKRYDSGQSYNEIAKAYKTKPNIIKARIDEYYNIDFLYDNQSLTSEKIKEIDMVKCFIFLSTQKNNYQTLAKSLHVSKSWLRNTFLNFCKGNNLKPITEYTNKKIVLEDYKKLVEKKMFLPKQSEELGEIIYVLVKNKNYSFKEIANAFCIEKKKVEAKFYEYQNKKGESINIIKNYMLLINKSSIYKKTSKLYNISLYWLKNEVFDLCKENDLQILTQFSNKKMILENYKKLIDKEMYFPKQDEELGEIIYLLVKNKNCNLEEIVNTLNLEKEEVKQSLYTYTKIQDPNFHNYFSTLYEIREKAMKENLTYRKASKELNISPNNINRKIDVFCKRYDLKNDIKTRNNNKQQTHRKNVKEVVKYHEEGLTDTQIAKIYGCSSQNINKKLKTYYDKLDQPKKNNAKKIRITLEDIINKNYENKTIEELAKEQGVSSITLLIKINDLCKTNNLNRTDYIKTEYEKERYNKEKKILGLYEFGYTQKEIAEKMNDYQSSIGRKLNALYEEKNIEQPIFLSKQEINKQVKQQKDLKEIEKIAKEKKKKIPTKKVIDALKKYRQDLYLYYLDEKNINRYNLEPTIKKEYQKIKEVNNYDRY